MNDNPVKDYLATMDAYIRDHGWVQGMGYSPEGKVCLWGAFWRAQASGESARWIGSEGPSGLLVAVALCRAASRHFPDRWVAAGRSSWSFLICFNDHPATTQEDIHLLLKWAQEEEEEETKGD